MPRSARAITAEEAEQVAQHACPQSAAMIRLQIDEVVDLAVCLDIDASDLQPAEAEV